MLHKRTAKTVKAASSVRRPFFWCHVRCTKRNTCSMSLATGPFAMDTLPANVQLMEKLNLHGHLMELINTGREHMPLAIHSFIYAGRNRCLCIIWTNNQFFVNSVMTLMGCSNVITFISRCFDVCHIASTASVWLW